jgi:hypothetical protein
VETSTSGIKNGRITEYQKFKKTQGRNRAQKRKGITKKINIKRENKWMQKKEKQ